MKLKNNNMPAKFAAGVIAIFLLVAFSSAWNTGHPFAWIMSFTLIIPLVLALGYSSQLYLTDDGKTLVKETGIFNRVIKEEYGMHIFDKIEVVSNSIQSENGKIVRTFSVVMVYKNASGSEGQTVNIFKNLDEAYAIARDVSALTRLQFEDSVAM